MAKGHSHVRKKRRGCLTGCLLRLVLLLGMAALLFVAACSLGIIKNDPQTGKPYVTLEDLGLGRFEPGEWDLSGFDIGNLSLPDITLPEIDWPYGVEREGLTVKTLRAGAGEAVLVCSDGYTMLLGGGEGRGILLCGQLFLSGVNRIDAAVAMQLADDQLGGMAMAVKLMKPSYLLYPGTQVKTNAYNAMMSAAKDISGLSVMTPDQGLTFSLGRATVRVVGPRYRNHTDQRDDGLSVRIDYGRTSVLVMGDITQAGERELIHSAPVDADVLIVTGGADTTAAAFVGAVSPKIALLTGQDPANAVKVRLERVGANVYTAKEHGVMTVFSDGESVTVKP